MTKEEEAIKEIKTYMHDYIMGSFDDDGYTRYEISEEEQNFFNNIDKLLNLLKEKDAEIEKKDNAIKKIINRLDNDIKRITETKRDRSTFPNYLDDYTKCRLKAYKTKTKEIKEYIKKQYFERKIR